MEKTVLLQKYETPAGAHETTCINLALAGARAGFDIIGMHKDKFDKGLLFKTEMIIVTDMLNLHTQQKAELKQVIIDKKTPYVRCVMDLSEIEANDIDREIYEQSKRNYFCSPEIFKKYHDLKIYGLLTFLAGKIDESWKGLPGMDKRIDERINKSIKEFWLYIDVLLQREKILNVN